MSTTSGASAPGNAGPVASRGPDAYQRGYQQGLHDQSVKDHETLVHEDPIGDVARGIATSGEHLVDKGIDALNEILDHSTRPESVHEIHDSQDTLDAGIGSEADATIPDATVNSPADADGAEKNPAETNSVDSNGPNQSFDLSQPEHDPGVSHDSSQSFDPSQPQHDPGVSHDSSQSFDPSQPQHDPGLSHDSSQSFDPNDTYDPGQPHDSTQ